MAEQTGIQWTDSTWNIVTGCTRVGPGCANCYIERTPPFRMQHRKFTTVGSESTTGVTLHWDRLAKVPRGPKIFTPSLGDLFHDEVPDEFIAAAFTAFAAHPDRIFQVLTKRPERALETMRGLAWEMPGNGTRGHATVYRPSYGIPALPLPNVWLGVSIENARYTWRADVLREIPAAVRFISAEPLLGSLYSDRRGAALSMDAPDNAFVQPLDLTGIDWVIIGGESGPKARPFHLEHAREIIRAAQRDCGCGQIDCVAHSHPAVFVKQLGAHPLAEHVYKDGKPAEIKLRDRKGGDMDEWPADLRIREFPRSALERVA